MTDKCYLDGTCDLTDKPLEKLLLPLSDTFTVSVSGVPYDFTILIVWAMIISIIWLRTHRIELVAIVGLLVASGLSATLPEEATRVGYLLIGLSIAVLLYQLVTERVLKSR